MATSTESAASSVLVSQAGPEGKAEENRLLDAWYDPLASAKGYSQNIALCDIDASGENKLLIAGNDRKLRVYAGNKLLSEHFLLEDPTAVCVYYTDNRQPHTPAVAVAGGSYVFIYRNLRPYFKFSLPPLPIDEKESEVWKGLVAGRIEIPEAIEALGAARDSGVELTMRSAELLSMENAEAATEFINRTSHKALQRSTVITCMCTLNKDNESIGAVGCLVIGTEAREVMILSPSGSAILKRATVPSVPYRVVATGLLEVDYRILCACRDGKVYTLRNMDSVATAKLEVTGNKIELDSLVVGMVPVSRTVIVGCMNRSVHCYHIKGKKLWSMYLPDDIVCMEKMEVAMVSIVRALVVALKNGEIRVYNEKRLVLTVPPRDKDSVDPVIGLKFGKYGREDGVLVACHQSGAMNIKILPRRTNFNTNTSLGPPPEQDIPLKVPRKTRLYVDQTQREREQAVEMHRKFQRDLCRLRLETARAYVKMITDGHGPSTYMSGANIRINATVAGLGPNFKLKVHMRNSGNRSVAGLALTLIYPHEVYEVHPAHMAIPLLLPGQLYHYEMSMQCLDANGPPQPVRIVMVRPQSAVPVLSAVIDMPASLPVDEEEM